jgi:hypothetical protein
LIIKSSISHFNSTSTAAITNRSKVASRLEETKAEYKQKHNEQISSVVVLYFVNEELSAATHPARNTRWLLLPAAIYLKLYH